MEVAHHLEAVGGAVAFRHYDDINHLVGVALILQYDGAHSLPQL